MIHNCKIHGLTDHYVDSQLYYRCKKCNSEAVTKRRKKLKEILVEEFGGSCIKCGYNKCVAALQFHHRNPEEKEFGLSARGLTRSIDKLRREAAKCDLLCANCHAELENGVL